MVRVIAGTAKGRKLKTIDSNNTRPTLDRVKEAMFSILLPWIHDATVVDVFAGNGSLGIEALSRGAKYAYFNDMSGNAAGLSRKTLGIQILMTEHLSTISIIRSSSSFYTGWR